MPVTPELLDEVEGGGWGKAEENAVLADGRLQVQVLEIDFELEDIEVAVLIELEAHPPCEPLGEFGVECEVAAADPGADDPLAGWVVVGSYPVRVTEK